MDKLSDIVERKFTDVIDLDDYEVLSEEGWVDISSINQTIPYIKYIVTLENGMTIDCADTHILMDSLGGEVYAKDSIDCIIKTVKGNSKVVSVINTEKEEIMYDLSLDSDNHTYYTDDILSHNSITTVAWMLHFILFNEHKRLGVIANKGATARKILGKLKLAYSNLPHWLQSGIVEWNKGSIELENGCVIEASSTSGDAVRGDSLSALFIDECLAGSSKITVRDKETGEIKETTLEELYEEE